MSTDLTLFGKSGCTEITYFGDAPVDMIPGVQVVHRLFKEDEYEYLISSQQS